MFPLDGRGTDEEEEGAVGKAGAGTNLLKCLCARACESADSFEDNYYYC